MKEEKIYLRVPVVLQTEDSASRRAAIKELKGSLALECYNAGDVNYNFWTKRPTVERKGRK